MYKFTENLKKYLLVIDFNKFQELQELILRKKIPPIIDGELIILHETNGIKAKYTVIKSFERREEAQNIINEFNFEFKIVKNSEEELKKFLNN